MEGEGERESKKKIERQKSKRDKSYKRISIKRGQRATGKVLFKNKNREDN